MASTSVHERPRYQSSETNIPGDEWIEHPRAQFTDHVYIAARPHEIWPWLVQMGHHRAGFYSAGWSGDDGNRTREVHPELQSLRVGDVLAVSEGSTEGLEVLGLDPGHRLVLGHLHDATTARQRPFASEPPPLHWKGTWTFLITPLDDGRTRLTMQSRFSSWPAAVLETAWLHPTVRQLRDLSLVELARRVEGKVPVSDAMDVVEGVEGAALMLLALLTPMGRAGRSHWGLKPAEAERDYPGDELVETPHWSWTHGVEIEASAAEVWPWVAQLGANRAGFYSYQWLENLAGCELRNAETIHPHWEVREGDPLRLHPGLPPMRIEQVEREHHWLASAPADAMAVAQGRPWAKASWLFFLEPLGPGRCRLISRYRVDSSSHLSSRLSFGPVLAEPIGFVMDHRMLLGIKDRVEMARLASAAVRPLSEALEPRP